MKTAVKRIFTILLFISLLRACGGAVFHEHQWQDATCTEPRTCATCNKTDGAALGHDYQGATCISYGVCTRCGSSGGWYAPHEYVPATCTEPEQCSVCGKPRHWYSLPLGHKWQDPDCYHPKTCSVCGETTGEPSHFFVEYHWDIITEATCQSEGEKSQSCRICGYTVTRTIPVTDHKAGDPKIIRQASPSQPGEEITYCIWCGTEMRRSSIPYMGQPESSSTTKSANTFNTYDNKAQQNTEAKYVLNTSTMKFHYPSCWDVPKISPQNYSTSNRSRDELRALGYTACGHCSP